MSSIKGIKVGTTNITASFTDGSKETDTQQLEVVSVSLDSIDTPSDVIYTGNSVTPAPTVYAYLGNGSGTKTPLVKDTDYTLTYENNINVGTAKVTATGKGNFSGTVYTTWEIKNASITVTKEDQSYTYNGNKQGDGIIVNVEGNQTATIKYRITSSGEYNLTDVPQKTHVSESGLVYYQVTAPNHTTEEGSYQLNITPYTATLLWGTSTIWRYDGDAHSTTCVVNNLIGNDSCTVTLSNNTITNVGKVTVTATGLSNSDYKLPNSGITQEIEVINGLFIKVSGTWTPVKKVYKKSGGKWELQDMTDIFKVNELYMEKE